MIRDWDDAYANGIYIRDGKSYPAKWVAAAQSYRDALTQAGRARLDVPYGAGERQRFDLFLPEGAPTGLAVFVHGGYWLAFGKSDWSHLAAGAVDRGWAVAMPSYTLAPQNSVSGITQEVASAIAAAAREVAGPVVLTGHSAGGHLVMRMMCAEGPLAPEARRRVAGVLPISGLADLRPLLATAMGPQLFRSAAEAAAESPALLWPDVAIPAICWVGGDERPEFIRQSDLLANIWTGLGADIRAVHEADRHHFDVIEGLADAGSPLCAALLGFTAAAGAAVPGREHNGP